MKEAVWIRANIEGRPRWYIAIDRGSTLYFPEINLEEKMNLEQYQKDFPNKVRAIPTVKQWDKMCKLAERSFVE